VVFSIVIWELLALPLGFHFVRLLQNDLLNIVTVNYNDFGALKITYSSILALSDKLNFKWIIIDGGSTDGSASFLTDISDDRKIVSISEPDDGIYSAMNKARSFISEGWTIYLNSGDMLLTNAIMVDENEIVCHPCSWHYPERFSKKNSDRFVMAAGTLMPHAGMLFPAKRLPWYDPSFEIAADVVVKLKVIQSGRFILNNVPISSCLIGGISQSVNSIEDLGIKLRENHRAWAVLGIKSLVVIVVHLRILLKYALSCISRFR